MSDRIRATTFISAYQQGLIEARRIRDLGLGKVWYEWRHKERDVWHYMGRCAQLDTDITIKTELQITLDDDDDSIFDFERISIS